MNFKTLSLSLIALAIVFGCSNSEPEAKTTPAPESTTTAKDASSAHGDAMAGHMMEGKASKLGEKVDEEHFAVILKADPEAPKKGKAKLIVEAWHHGEPLKGAQVRIETAMPEMKHDGPGASLKNTKDNLYEGEIELPMAGKYRASVLILSPDGHAGAYSYEFDAAQ